MNNALFTKSSKRKLDVPRFEFYAKKPGFHVSDEINTLMVPYVQCFLYSAWYNSIDCTKPVQLTGKFKTVDFDHADAAKLSVS